jgi:hypothetical protein
MYELLNGFVEPNLLPTIYLANPCKILQTINQGRRQHAKEQYSGGHTLPKGRRATAEARKIRGRRPKQCPERGGLPDARMISDRYTPILRPRRAGRDDGRRWTTTTTTMTKTFELAEGGYSCASCRGGGGCERRLPTSRSGVIPGPRLGTDRRQI